MIYGKLPPPSKFGGTPGLNFYDSQRGHKPPDIFGGKSSVGDNQRLTPQVLSYISKRSIFDAHSIKERNFLDNTFLTKRDNFEGIPIGTDEENPKIVTRSPNENTLFLPIDNRSVLDNIQTRGLDDGFEYQEEIKRVSDNINYFNKIGNKLNTDIEALRRSNLPDTHKDTLLSRYEENVNALNNAPHNPRVFSDPLFNEEFKETGIEERINDETRFINEEASFNHQEPTPFIPGLPPSPFIPSLPPPVEFNNDGLNLYLGFGRTTVLGRATGHLVISDINKLLKRMSRSISTRGVETILSILNATNDIHGIGAIIAYALESDDWKVILTYIELAYNIKIANWWGLDFEEFYNKFMVGIQYNEEAAHEALKIFGVVTKPQIKPRSKTPKQSVAPVKKSALSPLNKKGTTKSNRNKMVSRDLRTRTHQTINQNRQLSIQKTPPLPPNVVIKKPSPSPNVVKKRSSPSPKSLIYTKPQVSVLKKSGAQKPQSPGVSKDKIIKKIRFTGADEGGIHIRQSTRNKRSASKNRSASRKGKQEAKIKTRAPKKAFKPRKETDTVLGRKSEKIDKNIKRIKYLAKKPKFRSLLGNSMDLVNSINPYHDQNLVLDTTEFDNLIKNMQGITRGDVINKPGWVEDMISDIGVAVSTLSGEIAQTNTSISLPFESSGGAMNLELMEYVPRDVSNNSMRFGEYMSRLLDFVRPAYINNLSDTDRVISSQLRNNPKLLDLHRDIARHSPYSGLDPVTYIISLIGFASSTFAVMPVDSGYDLMFAPDILEATPNWNELSHEEMFTRGFELRGINVNIEGVTERNTWEILYSILDGALTIQTRNTYRAPFLRSSLLASRLVFEVAILRRAYFNPSSPNLPYFTHNYPPTEGQSREEYFLYVVKEMGSIFKKILSSYINPNISNSPASTMEIVDYNHIRLLVLMMNRALEEMSHVATASITGELQVALLSTLLMIEERSPRALNP